MLPDEVLDEVERVFQSRIDKVTEKYLKRVGEHINSIGKLTASDVSLVRQIQIAGKNVTEIEREIKKTINDSSADVRALIEEAAKSVYGESSELYDQAPFKSNVYMARIVNAQTKQALDGMQNLSRTRVVSKAYKKAVDEAVTATQLGATDYNSAIRGVMRQVSGEGLRVQYENGLTRRLDTAVRQNVTNAVRQINQDVALQTGQEFGADGVEISVHINSADDHADIQGEQYTLEEYDNLQTSLDRPIGDYNCRHFARPILIGISEPAYSKEQINSMREKAQEQIEIDGVTKSRYEWTQVQRQLETAVRYQKDDAVLFAASGDKAGRRAAQANIDALTKQYQSVSKSARIPTYTERMAVSGFRPVKA